MLNIYRQRFVSRLSRYVRKSTAYLGISLRTQCSIDGRTCELRHTCGCRAYAVCMCSHVYTCTDNIYMRWLTGGRSSGGRLVGRSVIGRLIGQWNGGWTVERSIDRSDGLWSGGQANGGRIA